MRKILISVIMMLGLSFVASAQNLKNGSYICAPVALADNNWNIVMTFSKDQIRKMGFPSFIVDNSQIINKDGIYRYVKTDKSGSEIFYNYRVDSAIIIPNDIKNNNSFFLIGFVLGVSKNPKEPHRVYFTCKRQRGI